MLAGILETATYQEVITLIGIIILCAAIGLGLYAFFSKDHRIN